MNLQEPTEQSSARQLEVAQHLDGQDIVNILKSHIQPNLQASVEQSSLVNNPMEQSLSSEQSSARQLGSSVARQENQQSPSDNRQPVDSISNRADSPQAGPSLQINNPVEKLQSLTQQQIQHPYHDQQHEGQYEEVEGAREERLQPARQQQTQHIAIVEEFLSITHPDKLNIRYKEYNDEKKKTLYLGIFIKIGEAVQISDIDRLEKLDKLISYINSIEEKKVLLETFYNNDNNPMKSTNLIILACKHNRPEVLNYLFTKQIKFLDNLSTAIGRNQIRIVDVDEKGHTASYYAIRSNNVDLLKILIRPDNFFHDLRSTELDNLLSKDYEELKLRNVEISEIMQIFVEDRLIRERFFRSIINTNNLSITDDKNAQDTSFEKIDVIYKQINMIFIAVNDFTAESLKEEVDLDLSKTSFIARFIAQNIRILKRQLKSTYNQLPWEEIEFHLSRFAFLSTLERKNLQNHLINFADKLRRVFNYSNDLNDNKINEIKNTIKKYINSGIPRNREKISDFESLYNDYELIKDPYSLNKMLHYIELALSVSPEEQSGRLIIQRALQVIGEYLKASPQSPHLSDSIEETLIQMELVTITEIAPSLRNLLSHNNNLDRLFSRNSIEKEEGFFTKIQDDLRKIHNVITQVFYNVIKIRQFEKLCKDIISNDDSKKVKELSDEFINKIDLENTELEEIHDTDVLKKIENLVSKVRQINTKIEYTNQITKLKVNNDKLFTEIESIIASEKNKITYIKANHNAFLGAIRYGVHIIKCMADKDSDKNLKKIKRQYQYMLIMIKQKKPSSHLYEIMHLISKIFNNVKEYNRDQEIQLRNLVAEIVYIIYVERIRINGIEGFKEKLGTLEIDTSVQEDRVESELDDVLSTFKNKVNDDEMYQKLKSELENRKQIYTTKLKLIDHVKDKYKLTREEYNRSVKALDETEEKKKELDNYFDFKRNHDKCKNLIKKAKNHYGNFLEGKQDFNKLLNSLQKSNHEELLESNHEELLRNTFDRQKQLHENYTPESLLNDTINNIKDILTDAEYKKLNEKLEGKKGASEAKQKLIDFFENNSEMTAIEYGQLVDKLDTERGNKKELNKFYSSLSEAILAVESINDSYGAFIKAVAKKESTVNEICNSFNKFSETLQLQPNSHELLKKIFKEEKIKILEDYFSEKLSLLKKRLENVNCGSKHDLIKEYKHNEMLQAEIEMLLLDLSDISSHITSNIDQPPIRCLEKEFLSLSGGFPFLMGVSLRNYLAHGDALIDSLPFDPLIMVISNALIFTEEGESIIALRNLVKDSEMKDYLNKVNGNTIDKLRIEELPTELQQHAESIITLQQSDYWINYLKNMLSNKGNGNSLIVKSDVESHYDKNLKLLISQKELFDAVKQNDKQALENCLKRGDEIDARDSKMWTPLHTAALKGHKDVVEILLNNGTNVNSINKDKSTPLHLAAYNGQHLVVKVLLNEKAEINAKDKYDLTPLHLAVITGHKEAVEILLSHGADINSEVSNIGAIPLHLAAFSGNMDAIKFFAEKRGTNVNAKHKYGKTPLYCAAEATHNKSEVVEYLLGKGAIVDSEDNQKRTPLHAAANSGNKDIVDTLLDKGAKVESINEDKDTPLHVAARCGHDQVVEVLLKRGASVNAQNKNGYIPLHFAVLSENSKTIEHLFEKGANANIKTNGGTIPLHLATQHFAGNLDVIESLINSKRSDINTCDNYNRTPLHFAVQWNNLNCVKFLVENGANVNAADKNGCIPLHYCRGNQDSDMDIVGYLVEKGVDLNTPESNGRTLLHNIADAGYLSAAKYIVGKNAEVNVKDNNGMTPLHLAALNGNLNIIKFLVKKDADVPDNKKCTPLHYAAKHGYNKVVEFLLNQGAKIDAKDKDGKIALHLAAETGYIEVVNILLKRKKNKNIVNVSDKYKSTPLHSAVLGGHKKIVENLLKENASLNIPDENGMTPLHYAACNGNLGVIKCLVRKGANVDASDNEKCTPLIYASRCGHKDVVNILLEKSANVDVANSKRNRPLHCATWYGYAETVEVLLHSGAEVNPSNDDNITPLLAAVYNSHYQAFDILLKYVKEKFPDKLSEVVNVVDKNKMTPLHFAAKRGDVKIVSILLKNRANVNYEDNDGKTPLHFTAEGGHNEVAKILLDYNSNVNASDNTKSTPLHYAAGNGHEKVVELLLNCGAEVNRRDDNNITSITSDMVRCDGKTFEFLLEKIKDNSSDWTNDKDFVKFVLNQNGDNRVEIRSNEGVTPSHSGAKGITPLYYAAVMGHKNIIKVLLENGAHINFGESFLYRVIDNSIINILISTKKLFIQVIKGDLQEVKDCISKGAVVNAPDNNGVRPLHYAAWEDYIEITKVLLENGAHINVKDNDKRTPLHYAVSEGNLGVIKCLVRKGANVDAANNKKRTPIMYASRYGHKDVVKILLKKGANVNAADSDRNRPLHCAANGDHDEITKVLLENGAHINVKNNDGKTPLYYATNDSIKNILTSTKKLFTHVEKGNLQEVKDCLSKGAVVNALDKHGGRPLHYAAWKGYEEITKVLLKEKANPNVAGKNGYMPLHYATRFGNFKIIQLLLEKQADPNIQDENGKTPLDLFIDNFKTITAILNSNDKSQHEEEQRSVPLEECLPSTSSGRSTREAKIEECELSREDVDEFNTKKDDQKDFGKIKIDSEK